LGIVRSISRNRSERGSAVTSLDPTISVPTTPAAATALTRNAKSRRPAV
jgi:hypothetical protein